MKFSSIFEYFWFRKHITFSQMIWMVFTSSTTWLVWIFSQLVFLATALSGDWAWVIIFLAGDEIEITKLFDFFHSHTTFASSSYQLMLFISTKWFSHVFLWWMKSEFLGWLYDTFCPYEKLCGSLDDFKPTKFFIEMPLPTRAMADASAIGVIFGKESWKRTIEINE